MAIAEAESTKIHIYDGRSASSEPLRVLSSIHMKPVTTMTYNPEFDVVLSADAGGMLEYWSGAKGDYAFPESDVMFSSKLDTDLFDLAKNKTHALNMTVSPNGKFVAVYAADKKIRVFRFRKSVV